MYLSLAVGLNPLAHFDGLITSAQHESFSKLNGLRTHESTLVPRAVDSPMYLDRPTLV
jgi:hypothetical protein